MRRRSTIVEYTLGDFRPLMVIGRGTYGKVLLTELNHKSAPEDENERLYAVKIIMKRQLQEGGRNLL